MNDATRMGQPTHQFAHRKDVDVEPNPSISIRTHRWETAADLIVQGSSFTPGGDVHLLIGGVPGQGDPYFEVDWQAQDNGTLYFVGEYGLVYGDFQDANGAVFVMARDNTTGRLAIDRRPGAAAAWIVIVAHTP
jgi:hypothetical protein